ncbi:DUF2232 domain-containing protein [Thermodesulfobacteriota bacterium]
MRFKDVTGCASATILLLSASALVPFIGPFFGLLTPLPFLLYATKLGLYQGLKIGAVTLVIVGLIASLAGYPQMVFFCLEFCFLGMAIAEIFRRKLSFPFTILWGTLLMLFMGSIILTLMGVVNEMGPLEMISKYFQDNLQATVQSYEQLGLDPEQALQIEEYGKVVVNIIAKLYPSLMIIGTASIVWVNVVISKPLFRLGNLEYPDFGPLDQWHSPELMVWGVIAAGFASLLLKGAVQILAINALIVMVVIYVFHGISIVLFFLKKYNAPSWIRFGIYFLIIFQQIFLLGLAVAGLFDQWIDFRKIRKKQEQ